MPITNEKIKDYELLAGMYRDGYFPNFLVDKVKWILVDLCVQIENVQPLDEQSLLELTHAATEKINDLAGEFEKNGSELKLKPEKSWVRTSPSLCVPMDLTPSTSKTSSLPEIGKSRRRHYA